MRKTRLLLIALLIGSLGSLIPQVHATGIIFKSFCEAGINTGTTINCTLTGVTSTDSIIVNIFAIGVFNAFTVTDGQSNAYSEQVFSLSGSGSGTSTYVFTTPSAASGGSLVVTVATGGASRAYVMVVSEYSGITGFGKTGTDQQDAAGNSGTSTISLTGTSASSALIDDLYLAGSAATFTMTPNSGQVVRDSSTLVACVNPNICKAADTTANLSPTASWSWSGGSNCTPCFASHSVLELQSTPSNPVTTVTQCYGNCGSPPITLVNTNSTHAFAFNQSISVFYEFQSNLNGFLLNVTSNLAKITNANQAVTLGIYQLSACPSNQTPFSASCPGFLLRSFTFGGSSPKGRLASSPVNIPVFSGQWQGISISASLQGLDINDTNVNVPLFQTNGNTPLGITNAVTTTCACKMALWAWINGNTITTSPFPTTGPCSSGFGGIDCIFSSIVNSFCAVQTTSCLWASGLFWVAILTLISTLFLPYSLKEIGMENQKLPLGQSAQFFGVIWILIFSGLGLLPIWAPLLIFFLVAWEVKGKFL